MNLSFSSFNSSEKVPLPLFGFLARGVYLVPPFSFLKRLRHCGTFIGIHTISLKDLGIFPAVSLVQAALAYEFTRHEHYEHLSSCEHGLSSARMQMLLTAITRTLLMSTTYYMYFTLVIQWFLLGNCSKVC